MKDYVLSNLHLRFWSTGKLKKKTKTHKLERSSQNSVNFGGSKMVICVH